MESEAFYITAIDYLQGRLSAEEEQQLEGILAVDNALRERFDNLRIEQYLTSELSGKHLVAFESDLAVQPDLVARVSWHRELREKMTEYDEAEMRAELKGYYPRLSDEELDNLENITPLQVQKINMRTILAIAATLLLLIAAGWFMMKPDKVEGDLFATYFEPYPMLVTQRGETAEVFANHEAAIEAYEEGRYAEAAELFTSGRMPAVIQLYSGISYLASDNYVRALDMLQPLTNNADIAEQAQWYLALTYLKLNDMEHCRLWLGRMIDTDGHAYRKRAERILRGLDDQQQ